MVFCLAAAAKAADPLPRDAIGWAIAHQVEQPANDRPLWRYLWIPPYMVPRDADRVWDERHVAAALSYNLNEAASQTGLVIQPQTIANGWMLACYLPNYASTTDPCVINPKISQLQRLIDVWDGLAADDPYFHVIRQNAKAEGVVDRVAIIAPHITQGHGEALGQLNASPAMVYRADWFLERLIHLRYYEFMQVPGTLESVLKTLGANEKDSQELDGDQRVGIFTSGISGKPRQVHRFQGKLGRHGTGAIWLTQDVTDENADVTRHPIYNLLDFQPDGGEVIFERSNGLHGYVLVDGQNNLVREAGGNLVADHNIPAPPDGPGTKRLVPGISCIRCHGPAEGLQPAPNNVQQLLASGTDILDDLGNVTGTQSDTVLRLAGLYAGDFDERLIIGRDTYEKAIRRATRMPGVPQGMSTIEVSELTSRLYGDYAYQRVDTARAVRELGQDPGLDPVATLNRILPRPTTDESGNILRENAVIASLRAGIPVRRRDWEPVIGPALMNVKPSEN